MEFNENPLPQNEELVSTLIWLVDSSHRNSYPLSVLNMIRFPDNNPTGFCTSEPDRTGFQKKLNRIRYGYPNCVDHLPSLHCTVIGFALNWESHKSLRHDCECLTELLERAFFQPYPIQRIQLAEVGWEYDDKGFGQKTGWVACIKSWATFSVLV